MFAKLLRSTVIGLIVAGLLLAALPVLRYSNQLFAEKMESTADETPAGYNKAVRRAAPQW